MKRHRLKALMIVMCISAISINGQNNKVVSKVYKWEPGKKNILIDGSTTDMKDLTVYSETIRAKSYIPILSSFNNFEKLFIVKDGTLNFTVNQEEKNLAPGSIVLVYPGDKYSAYNSGSTDAVYYVFNYRSKNADHNDSNSSFMIDWDDLEFHPHDKGGIRNYFERSTKMMKRGEMHVTTLNAGIKSHEPHTHRAAEFLLMISGNTQMQIGKSFYNGTSGDIYFLGSDVPHAIENVGKESCMYFAFQFE